MNTLPDDSSATLPPAANWLGYGGLLPFITLAPASLLDDHHALFFGDALFAYGAVILSFLGALHWGFAMTASGLDAGQRKACIIWSVIPVLLAWPALLLAPPFASLLLLVGFSAAYWQDRRLAKMAGLPAGYLVLRFRLTLVACLCLAAGAFSSCL